MIIKCQIINNNRELSIFISQYRSQGGFILNGRVGGQLAITRALGDLAFKTIGASNVPEIQ